MVDLKDERWLKIYSHDLKDHLFSVRYVDDVTPDTFHPIRSGFEVNKIYTHEQDGKRFINGAELLFEVYKKSTHDEILKEMKLCAGMINGMVEGKNEHTIDTIRAYYLL
jgi:hypothetical protein